MSVYWKVGCIGGWISRQGVLDGAKHDGGIKKGTVAEHDWERYFMAEEASLRM